MTKYDVVLLTESRYLNPTNPNQYSRNILLEDRLIYEALERQSLRCHREDWASPDFDWSQTRFALFRSTWDYFHRFDEFSRWLSRVEKETTLINQVHQIRWNMDKHYLRDLRRKGINTVETHFIEAGDPRSLGAVVSELGLDEFVLKPAISGAGRHTYRVKRESVAQYETVFRSLVQRECMLVQPFLGDIVSRGEVSLMLFGGEYSHAVLKRAKAGDFRVQDDFGGTVTSYVPSDEEIKLARQAFAACEDVPVYGRADIVRDPDGHAAIAELELIEPELWLRQEPLAVKRFAIALKEYLSPEIPLK